MARISPGVKNKPKLMQDLCSDCGSTDPSWASVNKGILICDGCCSIHRSLGRHLSVVKSLTKGKWHPSELTMVYSLNNSGANNIWEHALLDPSSTKIIRKKPQPTDPIHPTKADFIRAKHQLLSFVYRPTKEENSDMDKDTSKQLHASVRTPNLETSLRLLSLGADPNYLNEDKGNCPLHVAAMTGQGCQVELLVLYGGDPLSLDKDGKTPIDYARENGFNDIADRLIGLQYELTDRLSFYLCGRSPDHATGQHWVIPDLVNSESTQQAQLKLIALPNQSLKQLACDIYDEVDRRELDAVWLSLQSNQSVNSTKSQSSFVSDRCSVPFLPVNPELSSTRNQGRQKLARFNSQEFSVIVFDVLTEIQRRMTASLSSIVTSNDKSHCDHHSLTETSANQFADRNNAFRQTCPAGSRKNRPQLTKCPQNRSSLNYNYHLLTANTTDTLTASSTSVSSSPRSFTLQKSSNVTKSSIFPSNITDPILLSSTHTSHTSLPFVPSPLGNEEECEPVYDSVASEDDYSSLERRRMNHQGKFLENQNTSLGNQLKSDYDEVHEECTKNAESMKSNEDGTSQSSLPVSIEEYLGMKRHLETSELQIRELQQSNIAMTAKLDELTSIVFHLKEENDSLRFYDSSKSHLTTKQSAIISPHFSTPTHRNHHTYAPQEPRSLSPHFCNSSTIQRYNNCDRNSEGHYEVSSFNNQSELDASSEYFSLLSSLPSQDEVVRKTELITRRIQDLLQAAQESEYDKFIPCSEQIIFAVKEMTTLFPKNGSPPIISQAIHQLSMSACRLQSECRNHISSQLHLLDPGTVTQQVIQCAYDIAKAAKSLVTHFQ